MVTSSYKDIVKYTAMILKRDDIMKFDKYLKEIGEIPKNIEFDFEKDNVVYRYLSYAIVHDTHTSYAPCRYGEVLVNGEVIGWFKCEYGNWFHDKFIHNEYEDNKPIKRIWGVCHYIFDSEN